MNPTKPEQTASPEVVTINDGRRKLIRAGMATGPVIATLASPSVFAVDCVAPSQTLSAAQSHATTQLGSCSAPDTVGTWTNTLGSPHCTTQQAVWRDTKFHDVFTQQGGAPGCRMFKQGSNGTATPMSFYEVLCVSSPDSGTQISQQFVAAYLNVCANKVMFPVGGISSQSTTAKALVDMWNEWASMGSYTPYSGAASWDGTKVSYYLTHFVPKT